MNSEQTVVNVSENAVPAQVLDTIHAKVQQWSRTQPDAPAVVTAETTVTYGELDARAERLAAALVAHGVGQQSRVAVALPRGPGAVVAFLAVLKAGGTYVPLDLAYPEQRRAFILRDAEVTLALSDAEGAKALAGHDVGVLSVEDADEEPRPDQATLAGPEHAAYVVYTSGSTGLPKGVVVDHASVLRLVDDESRIAVQPGQAVAHLAPVAFDASIFEIWGALCRGGQVVVLDPRASIAELGAALRRWTPDWLFLTTGLFHLLAQHDVAALDSVGCLITGGDVLSPAHINAAARTKCQVYAAYGPTETTVFASLHRIVASDGDSPEMAPVSIGTELAGKALYILGPDLRPVADGEVGEIYIGGLGIARGYHQRPALTAERFLPDPFSQLPGRRMYRTGDLGRRAGDGTVDFHGRVDRQVKVRGFRVEPGEIESTLLGHPDVGTAAVVAVGGGDREKRLVGYVVPAPGRTLSLGLLSDWLGERLPAYLVPATFVPLESMELDPNGKPDRTRLPDPFKPRAELTHLPPFAPAETVTERAIAGAWADVLELDMVGIDDDFLMLGGDSLRSVSVLERLRKQGIVLNAGQFFTHPTIRELAAAHDAVAADGA